MNRQRNDQRRYRQADQEQRQHPYRNRQGEWPRERAYQDSYEFDDEYEDGSNQRQGRYESDMDDYFEDEYEDYGSDYDDRNPGFSRQYAEPFDERGSRFRNRGYREQQPSPQNRGYNYNYSSQDRYPSGQEARSGYDRNRGYDIDERRQSSRYRPEQSSQQYSRRGFASSGNGGYRPDRNNNRRSRQNYY